MTDVTAEISLMGEDDADEDAPGRHRNLERICNLLQAIMHGRAAQRLLDRGIEDVDGRLVILDSWDWRMPAMEIGRKGVDRETGRSLLMPVRLDWGGNDALVQVVPVGSGRAAFRWRAKSMGWSDSGNVEVSTSSVHRMSVTGATLSGGAGSRAIRRELETLSTAGSDALWQFILGLEQFVASTVWKAHSAVSHEISGLTGKVQNVLHETGVEQVVNKMMFGTSTDVIDGGDGDGDLKSADGSASVMRMVELCLRPDCFTRVDPMKYMHRHLRRDAEDEVRKLIGDPRIGAKIRRIAAGMRGASLEQIVEQYRVEYPGDRLSLKRAEAALSVRSDPMAGTVLLDQDTNGRALV